MDDHDTYFTDDTIAAIEQNSLLKQYDYMGQLLEKGLSTGIMLNHIGRTKPNSYWTNRTFVGRSIPFLHGGGTYILSRKALQAISSQYNFRNLHLIPYRYALEDHMVGDLLYNYKNLSQYQEPFYFFQYYLTCNFLYY